MHGLDLALIAGSFVIAGAVKGVIGLGLPTVSLALLTVVFDLPSAMVLLLVPSFVTNLWQALAGGQARIVLRRIWPFLLLATLTIWIGAGALRRFDLALLSALLGALLLTYASASLAGLSLKISARQETWIGPLAGLVNGLLTGMTGSFVVPGVMYLQAIGLTRDALIQAMGMLFAASTLALAIALQGNELLPPDQLAYSAIALIPAIIGMFLGRRLRQKISEDRFRQVFFIALLVLGLYILVRALADYAG